MACSIRLAVRRRPIPPSFTAFCSGKPEAVISHEGAEYLRFGIGGLGTQLGLCGHQRSGGDSERGCHRFVHDED